MDRSELIQTVAAKIFIRLAVEEYRTKFSVSKKFLAETAIEAAEAFATEYFDDEKKKIWGDK